jgi:hypothetical protein
MPTFPRKFYLHLQHEYRDMLARNFGLRLPSRPHGVTAQNATVRVISAVKTSQLARRIYSYALAVAIDATVAVMSRLWYPGFDPSVPLSIRDGQHINPIETTLDSKLT